MGLSPPSPHGKASEPEVSEVRLQGRPAKRGWGSGEVLPALGKGPGVTPSVPPQHSKAEVTHQPPQHSRAGRLRAREPWMKALKAQASCQWSNARLGRV